MCYIFVGLTVVIEFLIVAKTVDWILLFPMSLFTVISELQTGHKSNTHEINQYLLQQDKGVLALMITYMLNWPFLPYPQDRINSIYNMLTMWSLYSLYIVHSVYSISKYSVFTVCTVSPVYTVFSVCSV